MFPIPYMPCFPVVEFMFFCIMEYLKTIFLGLCPESPGYVEMVEYLTDALNALIKALSDEFFRKFSQYEPYVKADELNQAKRIFKSIYSIHKKHPYPVIPLDVNNPIINFNHANLPLKDEVLETGETWYIIYDDDNGFLRFLKMYLEEAREKK